MDTIIIIVTWIANNLIPSHLWSRWNVCRGVFLVTWSLIFLLSVEQLVFMSINISTSWVDWWPLVASFSACRWLSDVLFSRYNSWGWIVSLSWYLTLVVVSLGWYLRASFNGWLNSQVSLALKSWLWCFTNVFLAQFVEINGVLFNLILGNCWKVSSLEVLNSLWLCVRDHVGIFHIEFLEVWCGLDSHACWSLELSVLILGLWQPLGDLTQVSWASDGLQ